MPPSSKPPVEFLVLLFIFTNILDKHQLEFAAFPVYTVKMGVVMALPFIHKYRIEKKRKQMEREKMLWKMKELHGKEVEADELLAKLKEEVDAEEASLPGAKSKIEKADDDPGPKPAPITKPAKGPGKDKDALVPRSFDGTEPGIVTHAIIDSDGYMIDRAHGLPEITQQDMQRRHVDHRSINALGSRHLELSDCLTSFFCVLGAILVTATVLFVVMKVFNYCPSWYHTKRRAAKQDVEKQWDSVNQQMQVPFLPFIC